MKKQKYIIAVLGAGNMGTAMAFVLAGNGHEVKIWNWEQDHQPLRQIEKFHENKKYLPGVKLPDNIKPTYQIDRALAGAEAVFMVVPSGAMEYTISFAARSIKHNAVIVDVSKGVEPESLRLIPHLIIKHVRPALKRNVVTISGPAIASQMVAKSYTAMNVAGKNRRAIRRVVEVLQNDYVKLVPTSDVIGVEAGGSFKNVYAIAVGICDGLGYGLNTKAALLTNALAELADLIKAMGGRRQTAYELAGLGDLMATAFSHESRNRQFGEYLGQGLNRAQAGKKMKQTVEGVAAAQCLSRLMKKYRLHGPLADMVYACLRTTGDPRRIFRKFIHNL